MDIQPVVTFIRFTQKFRSIARDVHVVHDDRMESDMEHSYQLALLCWYVISTQKLAYDLDLVIRYALVHDLVETYAGDTPGLTSSEELKASKKEREERSLERIAAEFTEFPEMTDLIRTYEQKEDKESRLVATFDKIMPMLNQLTDNTDQYYIKHAITQEKWLAWLNSKLAPLHSDTLDDAGLLDSLLSLLETEKERMFAQ